MDYQLAMLTEINDAVVSGVVKVDSDATAYIDACAKRINDGDQTAWTDFTTYLRDHQSTARLIGRHLVGVGYRFLDDELDRLRAIKAERPLNEDERNYGLHVLTELINDVTKLASKTGAPDSKP